MNRLTIALAGNPNAGKSTLFNYFTGLKQHTGNWPGKTVAKKSGYGRFQNTEIEFVDLPGTYSLAAYSPDEIVARDFIINDHPDATICVVDATNLERNLYLVLQLLELGTPLVIALNMIDQAQKSRIQINSQLLSELLNGVPIVETAASRGFGTKELLSTTIAFIEAIKEQNPSKCGCHCESPRRYQVPYDPHIESSLNEVEKSIASNEIDQNGYCTRWLALKLIEREADVVDRVGLMPGGSVIVKIAKEQNQELKNIFQDDVDIITADQRYLAVSDISRKVLRQDAQTPNTLTKKVDDIVTNRVFGLPIFLLVMYFVFRLVIDVSAPFLDWVDSLVTGPITTALWLLLERIGAASWLQSLVLEGIVAGVGGILTFVPGLMVLFFFLALLEDTGYLARAAFVLDRFMQHIGLHGKSVIPLMLGFGCAVPAIYATRTISNRRDRLLTALLIPFMSCSARLPVYVVFAMAFFSTRASTVIWLMYVLGIIVAILVGLIFSRSILKPDGHSAFLLELPPYRIPTLKSLTLHTWKNTREFVQKAGTVILLVSVVLWFLLNLPWGVSTQQDSFYGQLSQTITPIMEPTGFGSNESSGALITGLIAKELIVSTLAQIYVGEEGDVERLEPDWLILRQEVITVTISLWQSIVESAKTFVSLLPGLNLTEQSTVTEDTSLSRVLRDHYSPLAAVSFLVFVLLYIPCVATIGAIKQEFGGRWASAAAVYQTLIAWVAAVLIFQGGQLLGFG